MVGETSSKDEQDERTKVPWKYGVDVLEQFRSGCTNKARKHGDRKVEELSSWKKVGGKGGFGAEAKGQQLLTIKHKHYPLVQENMAGITRPTAVDPSSTHGTSHSNAPDRLRSGI